MFFHTSLQEEVPGIYCTQYVFVVEFTNTECDNKNILSGYIIYYDFRQFCSGTYLFHPAERGVGKILK